MRANGKGLLKPGTPLFEEFVLAAHQAVGPTWISANELFFVVDRSLWPTEYVIGLGKWLGKHEGTWAGDLTLQRRERPNWSALWRCISLDELLDET